jgi:hexokinase
VHEGLFDIFGEKGRYVIYDILSGLRSLFDDLSNIITHHAEDGSGVGSAIIAGKLMTAYLGLCAHLTSFAAMTKIRKDAGLYAHV